MCEVVNTDTDEVSEIKYYVRTTIEEKGLRRRDRRDGEFLNNACENRLLSNLTGSLAGHY